MRSGRKLWLPIVAVLVGVGLVLQQRRNSDPVKHDATPASPVKSVVIESTKPLPGDALLVEYGSTNSTAREDLRQVLRVFSSALILVKQADVRHYATNEDLAEFLRGNNPNQLAMVSASSPLFDQDGRLLDRWGNPLVVHPVSSGKIELRSAGPDGVAWNDDDVMVDSPR